MTQHAVGFVSHIYESIPSGSGAKGRETMWELDVSGAGGSLLKLERIVGRDGITATRIKQGSQTRTPPSLARDNICNHQRM